LAFGSDGFEFLMPLAVPTLSDSMNRQGRWHEAPLEAAACMSARGSDVSCLLLGLFDEETVAARLVWVDYAMHWFR
jgi:hypothetical protein